MTNKLIPDGVSREFKEGMVLLCERPGRPKLFLIFSHMTPAFVAGYALFGQTDDCGDDRFCLTHVPCDSVTEVWGRHGVSGYHAALYIEKIFEHAGEEKFPTYCFLDEITEVSDLRAVLYAQLRDDYECFTNEQLLEANKLVNDDSFFSFVSRVRSEHASAKPPSTPETT